MIDDLELARCIACEVPYGSDDCQQCPIYKGEEKEDLE